MTPSILKFKFFFFFSSLFGFILNAQADDVITLGYGEGFPGESGVAVAVTARHDDLPIHGFSLALAFPQEALRLAEISIQGTSTEAVGVDFSNQILDNVAGTGVLGVIFSFSEPYEPLALPSTKPFNPPQLLAFLFFDVKLDAPAGLHQLKLLDGIGDPPVSNRFSNGGSSIYPEKEHGSFMVYSKNVITLDSQYTFPGFRAGPIYAHARHPDPLQGFQLAISFDPRALTLEEATINGTVMFQVLGMSRIEFLQINWLLDDILISPSLARTTAGVIFDYVAPYSDNQVLPPFTNSNKGQTIMKYSFQPKANADEFGESIPLTLSDRTSPSAINNVFIIDSKSVVPRKNHGRIYFSTGNLKGKVLNYQTSQPVASARIVLYPGEFSAFTKGDGSFLFEEIPPGEYSALVTRNGYFPLRVYGEVAGKNAISDLGTVLLYAETQSGSLFRRGMVNSDGQTDLSDIIALLGIIFLGDPLPGCADTMDINDDGNIDISDPIYYLDFQFLGGKVPPPPFGTCGQDLTPDGLNCLQFPHC